MTAEALAGSLLGLCLGDALGAPVEAMTPADALEYVRELRANRVVRSRPPFEFGQYTDDGQLARELLASIAEHGSWNPASFARRLASFAGSCGIIGAGPATSGTIARLAAGVPWRVAGEPPPYAGNGAAMRAAPIGVLWAQDHDLMRHAVLEQAGVTHHARLAGAGALVIAHATALCAQPALLDPGRIIHAIVSGVEPVDHGMAAAIGQVREWLELEPSEARDALAQSGVEPHSTRAEWRGISAYVVGSVCWSLYAALRHPDSYPEAVFTAIGAGGDTDTLGAMTGGIVGARVGAEGLPRDLLGRINDQGAWRAAELDALARRCWWAVHGPRTPSGQA